MFQMFAAFELGLYSVILIRAGYVYIKVSDGRIRWLLYYSSKKFVEIACNLGEKISHEFWNLLQA